MKPPLSRSQMDKLGVRMAANGYVDDADSENYTAILDFYQSLLDYVSSELAELSLHCSSRVKTAGTLVEKLIREPSTKLTRIHDLAGARITVDGDRAKQNMIVRQISDRFSQSCPRIPEIIDRRSDPRSGYRAVHVVVFPWNYPVEIQVRTTLQNLWAQIYESLADQWGRAMRYGGEPDEPSRLVRYRQTEGLFAESTAFDPNAASVERTVERRRFIRMIQHLSNVIDRFEVLEISLSTVRASRVRLQDSARPIIENDGSIDEPMEVVYASLCDLWNMLRSIEANMPELVDTRGYDAPQLEADSITAEQLKGFIAILLEVTSDTVERLTERVAISRSHIIGMLDLLAGVEDI